MKAKKLFLCLLFLVLGTTAWADKYYQPGSYRGDTTPRLTLEQAVGKKFMIYNTAINGNEDRTGFLRNNGVKFEHDKTKERDLFVYNESFVYTMERYTDDTGTWYAIKSLQTGLYVNAAGKTDILKATDAKLVITPWEEATEGKSAVNMENWKYNIIANGQITSGGHGSTVFVVKNYNGGNKPYWNGTVNAFDTWSDGHPFAFYIANEFTSEESYLQDLHIYSRCDIYSAQVIYGLVQSPSQITTNHPSDEGEIANLLDGDGISYHVSDWRENNADDYHYYQVDLGKGVESLYLYMQRRADGKNAPTKYELQVCATPDGQFETVGGERETNLADSNVYASEKINLGGSYQYIRIVAKERTVKEDGNFMCMGLSELYVLPGTTAIKDAIDYIAKATTDPVYTRATAKVYKNLVERYNTECPDAKLLSGVPLPGNKYRIYADAFDVENGVYVNREIKADNGLLIKEQGSYNAESDDSEQDKYEWYCEQTFDGYLAFRNVADPTKYLANGAVADEPYKWSISTFGTQRFGVPLKNIEQQYLAVENNGGHWMGNVRDVQNQTVAPANVDDDNNADTAPVEVASGLCTDFVFIPVPLEGEEKKITIIGNELVKRNTKLLFDSNGDGIAEVHSLPFSRMFVNATKFSTMRMQLLCKDIHVYQGIRLNDEEGLNTTIATPNGDELSFDFSAVNDGDILDIQLQIEQPFEVMSSDFSTTEKPSLYLIRNKHQQGLAQQARPNRAADVDIEIGGGDGPISSQTGKRYYAKFNQRGAYMDLVEGYEDWTATEFEATSLFYFTETEDTAHAEYYSVNIHNATTVMKCADHAAWNTNGNTWFVQPKNITNNYGYNIGRSTLNANNNPENVWGCDHENGNKIAISRIDTNGKEVRIRANDDGTAWEFIKVDDDTAKKMLNDFIVRVAEDLDSALDAKATQEGIDTTKVKYYRFIIDTMTERAAGYYNGTFSTPGDDATAKLLQFAQNIHMVEHEIQYALYELPDLSEDVIGVLSQLDNAEQPHWYYIRNVNGVVDGNNSYAAFNGNNNQMVLQQYAADADKKLANMFYIVGEKNSYAPVMDSVPDNNGLYHDFPGNNLIVDEYLKVHVHNFLAKEVTLVSKNVQLDTLTNYFPGHGQQTVMSNLSLKGDEDWSIELEYDLAGNTSFNAYGSCLLAGSKDPTKDNYAGEFQVYLKDDRSIVIKVNNADDRYRFWHTQDYYSHIKVVITYSQKTVTLDVYNSLGEKETMTIPEKVTLNDVSKLTSALPAEGARIASLKTYQVEAMTWKTHEEVAGDANKDEWYILPSSNENHVGLAIVLGEPNDTKMGWTNGEGSDTYITTDLGTADNSTWKFERVTDFDAHMEELLGMYNFEDCVIYDRELAALMGLIEKNKALIEAKENGEGEEALFNEVYYAFLNYKGRMPEHLKAPNPGVLYTIRPAVEEYSENALLVHTDWTNNTYTSKEVYLDDVINDEGEGKISYSSRAAWVFEGADGSKITGLKAKNLHTQCYMTALGADKSVVNEEDAATVTLSPLGACTTMFKVGDEYMNRTAVAATISYDKNANNFWGSAVTASTGVQAVITENSLGDGAVHCKSTDIEVRTTGDETTKDVTVTFTYDDGSHKINVLGVELVAIDGKVKYSDYRYQTAGSSPNNIKTYTLAKVLSGTYTLNCYVYDPASGDDLTQHVGHIDIAGVAAVSGAGKIVNDGTATTKWIVEEIKDPENSIYFNVASLSSATLPDGKAYASLYLGFDAKIPDGITAWIVEGVFENNVLDMVEVDGGGIVPANTGLILSSESPKTNQKFYYSAVASTFDAEDNILTGTPYTKIVDCREQNVYMLGKKNDRIALYWTYENRRENGEKYSVNGTTNHNEGGYVMCNANKSYLEDDAENENAVSVFGFSFGGNTTDIDEVSDEVKGDSGNVKTVYDLQGRRLVKVTSPGIYIVDGKKVYVTEIEE